MPESSAHQGRNDNLDFASATSETWGIRSEEWKNLEEKRLAMATKGDASPVYHAPTLNPGLGAPRCPRCAAPLSKDLEASGWTIAPFLRESFGVVGTAVGGSVGAFYGFNNVMPTVHKYVKGPLSLQFLAGVPPIILFSVTCAGLAGGALPAFAQLVVSTYHATSASSHSAISQLTANMEGRQEPLSFADAIAQAKASSQSQPAVKQRN